MGAAIAWWLPCQATTHAQGIFDGTPLWNAAQDSKTQSVAFGDVDRDGDLDLVCGNFAQSPTLYINLGGTLGHEPSWSSGRPDKTYGVALGDVDGDGDLDLVCGNWEASATLYRNVGGTFEDEPSWSTGLASRTQSVVLGDVDNDGDLDLVCGNLGQSPTLYRNVDGTFEDQPAWSSGRGDQTQSIALGDVDGDGDLDLVCGNWEQNLTFYRNTAGTFDDQPAWFSDRTDRTVSVDLGDMDGDGDLDLVCGNRGQSPTLYRNLGDTFEDQPAWSSGRGDETRSIALGDVDRDGDLDLVCGNSGQSPTLYRNSGDRLEDQPSWSSGRKDLTTSVALGDVDGDGDLDLVCSGVSVQSSTVYRNLAEYFETEPHWASHRTDQTKAVALGDVDGDGDLDLVCGNYAQPSTLYRNVGDTFEDQPHWSSGPTNTESIALGDVDGDGDLDLVCGNWNQGWILYTNVGGTFNGNWSLRSSDRAANTKSVALGDVDGDGDLDLVCGNYAQPSTLYRNVENAFELAWSSGRADNTTSVALDDVDGDGDLDLVCGNWAQSATLYRNINGTFEVQPHWDSGPADPTFGVALGDVDGDGDPDLVCGTWVPTLYRNVGGTFENVPFWSSGQVDNPQSVALGDVDGDGDLDLVCGNYTHPNRTFPSTLYQNVGGTFELLPTWTSGRADKTFGLALGDLDRDGDLDIVSGNWNQSAKTYRGKLGPPFLGNPEAPSNQQQNNDAYLRRVEVDNQPGVNRFQVRFDAVDVESDSVEIVAEYQFRGAPSWNAALIGGAGPQVGPFGASPGGTEGHFEWNTTPVAIDPRPVVLRLRTISNGRRFATVRHVATYLIDVGTVQVRRPVIATSVPTIALPRVTVGGTVSVSFSILNVGMQPLTVVGLGATSPAMVVAANLPLLIRPGDAAAVGLIYHPRAVPSAKDTLQINSSDPLRPVLSIPVLTDVRGLAVRSHALLTGPRAPLGERVGVVSTPLDSLAQVDSLVLHYRPRESADFKVTTMSPNRLTWLGYIPGAAVRETGVEFYVAAHNGDVSAFDPIAGRNDPHEIEVEPPASIEVRPQHNELSRFAASNAIDVEVEIPKGANFRLGTLHYRQGGQTTYKTESLVASSRARVYKATIPRDVVGVRGVEYWVEVETGTTQQPLRFPNVIQPSVNPSTIAVSVQGLSETKVHPGKRYRIVTVPLDFGPLFDGNLRTLLANDPEFGPYDPTRWRAFRYVPGVGNVEFAPNDPRFHPKPARAFWLITRTEHRVDTDRNIEGLSIPTRRPFAIVLPPGVPGKARWHQFGNPFAFPVAWDDVSVSDTVKVRDLITLTPGLSGSDDWTFDPVALMPFEGYFIRSASSHPETLWVHPVAATPNRLAALHHARQAAQERDRAAPPEAWRMRLSAHTGAASDKGNVFGVDPRASDESDPFDRGEPPSRPGSWVSVGFANPSWKSGAGIYCYDLRTPNKDGYTWDVVVRSSIPAEEVRIELSDKGTLSADLALRLIDHELKLSTDLVQARDGTAAATEFGYGQKQPGLAAPEASGSYHLLSLGPERPYRISLVAGTAEYVSQATAEFVSVPSRTVLDPNAPNPFNAATRIRFGLPVPEPVTLEVYDVRGRLVATLVRDRQLPAGYHSVIWNGTNSLGHSVASGVYLYRLQTSSSAFTKRLTVLK